MINALTTTLGGIGVASSGPGRRPTLRTVAERAGVSTATVSHVLNGTGRVSPETRRRVLGLARDLSVVPTATARAGTQGRTGILGLTMTSYGDAPIDYTEVPYYAQLILAAITAATERGHLLMVLPSSLSPWLWLTLPVDGVIHSEPHDTDAVGQILRQRGIPMVSDGRPTVASTGDAPVWVDNDHEHATRELLDHLWSRGARRVGVLIPRHDDAYPRLVREAYVGWCEGRQRPRIEEFDPVPDYAASESAAAARLVSGRDRPDAVFGLYTASGHHLLAAARKRRLTVPNQLLVACISEDPSYEHTTPPVTTVSLQPRLLGAEAVDLLISLINGAHGLPRQRLIPTVLHVRGSSEGLGAVR